MRCEARFIVRAQWYLAPPLQRRDGQIPEMRLLSLVIFREWPGWLFFAALAVMIAATVLVTKDQAKGA